MPIKPHPDYDEIRDAIKELSKRGKTFSAVCYRCTEPQFADQIVSGLGSQLHGARWTPKNSFPTVYLCETVEAALQEYLARGRRMKIPDHKSLPMVMAWVKVKAANLLDTTDAEIATVINPPEGFEPGVPVHAPSGVNDRADTIHEHKAQGTDV